MDDSTQDSDNELESEEEEIPQADVTIFVYNVPKSNFAKKRKPPVLWLITFTDIMALMLTFFVLLYTMSLQHEEQWAKMTNALNVEFHDYKAPEWQTGSQDTINIDRVDFSKALDLNYLQVLLTEVLKEKEAVEDIVFTQHEDRLVISLPDKLLFDSGHADIKSEGKQVLFPIGEALAKIKNVIEIAGHADPRHIPSDSESPFESNWHLSLARAANVAGILENTGYIRPVTIRGMSSARYAELPEDHAQESRLGLARRVDIVILKTTGRRRNIFKVGF